MIRLDELLWVSLLDERDDKLDKLLDELLLVAILDELLFVNRLDELLEELWVM